MNERDVVGLTLLPSSREDRRSPPGRRADACGAARCLRSLPDGRTGCSANWPRTRLRSSAVFDDRRSARRCRLANGRRGLRGSGCSVSMTTSARDSGMPAAASLAEAAQQVGLRRAFKAAADDPVHDAIDVGGFHGTRGPINSRDPGNDKPRDVPRRRPRAAAPRSTQRSAFIGQRGLKWQPGGGSRALAISPLALAAAETATRWNGSGIAEMRARGIVMARTREDLVDVSDLDQILPRYITAMRLLPGTVPRRDRERS